ncbi:MAG TPA: Gfo/Idh/MocA family oxidoreductase, partial [Acidimicrobiales bacterium]
MTLRMGLLGCGRIGRMHAELIAGRIPGLALTRVFDVRRESAEETAAALSCSVATTPDELIDAADVD